MASAVAGFKQGLQQTLRMVSGNWNIRVFFKGTSASTDGTNIYLPNVDLLTRSIQTDEEVNETLAYLTALQGYAWHEVAHIVEDDMVWTKEFQRTHGRFAFVMWNFMADIRIEHRFSKNGQGIREALEYVREQWVWQGMTLNLQNGTNKKERSLLSESMVALQILARHGKKNAKQHPLWRVLRREARRFAIRHRSFAFETRAAFALSKLEGGSQAVGEATLRFLEACRTEFAPLLAMYIDPEDVPTVAVVTVVEDAAKYAKALADDPTIANSLETLGLKEASERSQMRGMEVVGIQRLNRPPPPKSQSGASGGVAGTPPPTTTPASWLEPELGPLPEGCDRFLMIQPPKPQEQVAQDELYEMLILVLLSAIGVSVEGRTAEIFENLTRQFRESPNDGKPYIVYTNEGDRFVVPPAVELSELEAMRTNTRKETHAIQQRVTLLLRARTRTRWRGAKEEGIELDPGAMADIAVAANFPNRELRPYRDLVQQHSLLQTSVGLLVDHSGSMSVPWAKIQVARQCALAFADALDRARIDFAIWGFSSNDEAARENLTTLQDRGGSDLNLYGRLGGLHIETVKTFGESWVKSSLRLPNLGTEMNHNYDADSLEWAGMQLLRERAVRRVMFVLSDGNPLSREPEVQVGRQQKHLHDVIKGLREAKVEIVGIGILDDSVKTYYGLDSPVVQDLSDLTPVVMQQMEHLLVRRS